ncbi:MAG: redoxin domain-containing protein [Flavobacteriales bacterium]|nr:redoxin domain-containing protein [Flavobacteriales bacterium]
METDTANFVTSMKVSKSEENKAFYAYFNFLGSMQAKAAPLRVRKDQEAKDQLATIDKEVKAHQLQLAKDHQTDLFGAIIDMSIEPEIPKEMQGDTSKQLERYHFYKDHFFSRYHLDDERIVNTNIFAKKIKYFFDKIVVKHPDSILVQAYKLIDQLPERTDLFKYVVHTLTYKYETSKIMGMDAVFVGIARKYYCRDDKGMTKAFWLDDQKIEAILKAEKSLAKKRVELTEAKTSEDADLIKTAKEAVEKQEKKVKSANKNDKVNEICDRANTLFNLILYKPEGAPDLILQDTTEKNWVDIRDIKTDYKILVFWDPGCGHCKKEIPKLKTLYDELKSKNVSIEVIGINTELENKDWRKYLRDNDLNWINISDNPEINGNPRKYIMEDKVTTLQSLNFRDIYDIFSTPQIFVLNKENLIIAKKIGVYNLVEILERNLKIDIEYQPKKSDPDDKTESH